MTAVEKLRPQEYYKKSKKITPTSHRYSLMKNIERAIEITTDRLNNFGLFNTLRKKCELRRYHRHEFNQIIREFLSIRWDFLAAYYSQIWINERVFDYMNARRSEELELLQVNHEIKRLRDEIAIKINQIRTQNYILKNVLRSE